MLGGPALGRYAPRSVACYPAAKTAARLSPKDGSQPIRVTPASAPPPKPEAVSLRAARPGCNVAACSLTLLLWRAERRMLASPSDLCLFTSNLQLDSLLLSATAIPRR